MPDASRVGPTHVSHPRAEPAVSKRARSGNFRGRTVFAKSASRLQPGSAETKAQKATDRPLKARTAQLTQHAAHAKTRQHAAFDEQPVQLKELRRANARKEEEFLKKLENMPSPPTDKPNIKKMRDTGPIEGRIKALMLPDNSAQLRQHISSITTARELIETWNGLTHKGLKGELKSHTFQHLKTLCAYQMVKVLRDPQQASQINGKAINTIGYGLPNVMQVAHRIKQQTG